MHGLAVPLPALGSLKAAPAGMCDSPQQLGLFYYFLKRGPTACTGQARGRRQLLHLATLSHDAKSPLLVIARCGRWAKTFARTPLVVLRSRTPGRCGPHLRMSKLRLRDVNEGAGGPRRSRRPFHSRESNTDRAQAKTGRQPHMREKTKRKQWATTGTRREGGREGSLCPWQSIKVPDPLAPPGQVRSSLDAC